MVKKRNLCQAILYGSLLLFNLQLANGAEVLDINGDFAKLARCLKTEQLLNLGFVLGFDEFEWVSGWDINHVMSPACFFLRPAEGGGQAAQQMHVIAEKGGAHLFRPELLPVNASYTVKFMAKRDQDKKGKISVCIYEFVQPGAKFRRTSTIKTFDLSPQWTQFQCEMPVGVEYTHVRLVFNFHGFCVLKDISLERVGHETTKEQ